VQTQTFVIPIPRIIKEYGRFSVLYKGSYNNPSQRLQEYGKTPSENLHGILDTKKDSFELNSYTKDVENLFYWVNFFLDMCTTNPDFKRTCDEHIGWIKVNSSIIEKMKKDAKYWAERKYDQKTLANKFEKTRIQFLPHLQQLRRIFYQFEKGLYEGSNIQFQEPNNPVSD